MQTLEDSKQFVDILHVEADAVVSNHEYRLPILFLWLATDFDDGASAGAGELKRVSQQGLKDLPEQNGIARSEEHTSELQSHLNFVCPLLLEKKKYDG